MELDKENSTINLSTAISSTIQSAPRIIKVTDHVYVAVGYALANMIMIEGTDGIIIVDTTENESCALKILKELRTITDKPIKGIIWTHFHADHINGTPALLDTCVDGGKNVKIFAHSALKEERNKFMDCMECNNLGVSRQFGIFLTNQSALNLGKKIGRIIDPTHTFDDELDLTLAGVHIKLLHTPGETKDQLTVWIPEWRVIMPADNIYKAFPNLFAIRGSPPRNSEIWFKSLDKIKRLNAAFMVPSHLEPVIGEKAVESIITHYRDAIQFVNDQTVRLLNDGLEVDEIVEKVRLPPSLAKHPYLEERYGTVVWSVRGVIASHLGWFDRDPVNLDPLSKQARAERLNDLLSKDFKTLSDGVKKMLIVASENIEKVDTSRELNEIKSHREDIQWALELVSHALKLTQPDSTQQKQALDIAASCMKHLATMSVSPNARRYYKTCSMEIGTDFIKHSTLRDKANRIKAWPIENSMRRIRYSLKAEDCDDQETITVVFFISDVNQVHSYTLRHCILEYYDTTELIPQKFDVKLTLKSDMCKHLLINQKCFVDMVENGDIAIIGSVETFQRFLNLLNMCQEQPHTAYKSLL